MKHNFLALLFILPALAGVAQIDTAKKKLTVTPTKTTTKSPANTITKPTILQQGESNTILKLPDLKFSALNITATATGVANTYNLSISVTVKNEGTASASAANTAIQGYLSDERWITYGNKDLRMTGYLTAAGGQILGVPGKGEMIAPGATKQITYTLYNMQVSREPKPLFVMSVSMDDGTKEIDLNNNMAYTYIIL